MCQLKIIITDCGSNKVSAIKDILQQLGCQVSLVNLEATDARNLNCYDGIVISGGPHLFTQKSEYTKLMESFKFIPFIKKPTLGICLGHQAIGLYYGSVVYLGDERRQRETIKLVEEHPLLNNFPSSFQVTEDHCEGITLATEFKHLASSNYYVVEAMANDNKLLYGVQFHPETSPTQGQRVLANFVQITKNHLASS